MNTGALGHPSLAYGTKNMPESHGTVTLKFTSAIIMSAIALLTAAAFGFFFSHTQENGHVGVTINSAAINTHSDAINTLLTSQKEIMNKTQALEVQMARFHGPITGG